MMHWPHVFKFPLVERTTYDLCECTVEHQIFSPFGEKVVGDITAADRKEVLNHWMGKSLLAFRVGSKRQAGNEISKSISFIL